MIISALTWGVFLASFLGGCGKFFPLRYFGFQEEVLGLAIYHFFLVFMMMLMHDYGDADDNLT